MIMPVFLKMFNILILFIKICSVALGEGEQPGKDGHYVSIWLVRLDTL
jgi:hypothetical protein